LGECGDNENRRDHQRATPSEGGVKAAVSNPIGHHAEHYAGDAYDDGDRGIVVLDETKRQAGILVGWAQNDIFLLFSCIFHLLPGWFMR